MYDRFGKEGADNADQMNENMAGDGPHMHGGNPFGRAGGPAFHMGGGPGGSHRMSQQEADLLFSHFFGGSDPFGGGFSRQGRSPFGGGHGGGGMDPFAQMFMGGMPGGMGGMPGGMGGMPGGMGGMPRQARRQAKRYDAIPPGTIVSLKGLQSQPERNGDRGEVSEFDEQAGRYVVYLEDSDEYLRVKPSNLLQHVHVRLHGLSSQASWNGKRGTIVAWSDHKERYNIHVMDIGKIVSLKPANVVLENGTVGMIVGLQSKPELNGKHGTIKGFNEGTGRYDVQLSADQILRLKLENVKV